MLFYVHYEVRENATTHGILDQRYPTRHDIAGLLSFYGVSEKFDIEACGPVLYLIPFFILYTPSTCGVALLCAA